MPTPQSTFFRPQSLAQEGLCKTNLRGKLLYDYADSNITWTYSAGTLTTAAAAGSEPWTYFIPNAMTVASTDTITRSSLFSRKQSFTLMFRIYLDTLENPGSTGTSVIFNGTPSTSVPPTPPPPSYFWGIYFGGSPPTPSSSQMRFTFFYTSGGSFAPPLTISSSFLEAQRWYHVAVKAVDNGATVSLYGFLDGVQTGTALNQALIDAAVGSTRIGYNSVANNAQGFKITEIVYIEKSLTNNQIAAYAKSAFV